MWRPTVRLLRAPNSGRGGSTCLGFNIAMREGTNLYSICNIPWDYYLWGGLGGGEATPPSFTMPLNQVAAGGQTCGQGLTVGLTAALSGPLPRPVAVLLRRAARRSDPGRRCARAAPAFLGQSGNTGGRRGVGKGRGELHPRFKPNPFASVFLDFLIVAPPLLRVGP